MKRIVCMALTALLLAAFGSACAQEEAALLPRTASALVEFVESKLGCGYLFGATGEICSRSMRNSRAKQYPQQEQRILGVAEKWDGMEVYDCNGLIKAFLECSEGEYPKAWRTNVDGATKIWIKDIAPIETMPLQPGILLLQYDEEDGDFDHIGVYTGEGWCVHARGHAYGVVTDMIPWQWTHWGRATWLEYDLPAEEGSVTPNIYADAGDVMLVDTTTGYKLTVYAKPDTDTKLGVRLENHSLLLIDGLVEDEPYWRRIIVDDYGKKKVGYIPVRHLSEAYDMEAVEAFLAEMQMNEEE